MFHVDEVTHREISRGGSEGLTTNAASPLAFHSLLPQEGVLLASACAVGACLWP